MQTGDDANTLAPGVESRMTQEPPRVFGGVVSPHIQLSHSILRMTQFGAEKILVLCEKCNIPVSVEQRDDVQILSSQAAQIMADLSKTHSPLDQNDGLVFGIILVQENHAGTKFLSLLVSRLLAE